MLVDTARAGPRAVQPVVCRAATVAFKSLQCRRQREEHTGSTKVAQFARDHKYTEQALYTQSRTPHTECYYTAKLSYSYCINVRQYTCVVVMHTERSVTWWPHKDSLNALSEVPQLESLVGTPSLLKELVVAAELTPAQCTQRGLLVTQDRYSAAEGDNPHFAAGPLHHKVIKITDYGLFDAVHATDELGPTCAAIAL